MIASQQKFIYTVQMNYLSMFINNILSNDVYVCHSRENLGSMGVSSRTGVISAIYKKDDKEYYNLQTHLTHLKMQ